jgi:hypothetical protein
MSRSAGRRIATVRVDAVRGVARPSRELAIALAAVLLTVGFLAWAGAAGDNEGAAGPAAPRQAVGDRVFSCADELPRAHVLSGSLDGGLQQRPLERLVRVHVPQEQARGAFAARVATPAPSYAFGSCPEPANEWWFVGAGGSVGHSTTLVVDNPRPGSAVVDIEVLGPRGEVEAPGLRGITLPGNSSRTFDLTKVAPSTGELAAHVTTSQGLVSVTAVDSFTRNRIGGVTREWLPDQGSAERRLRLVGLAGSPASATLLVANPGTVEAVVELELVSGKGPFTPKGLESVTVAPGAVASLDLTRGLDGEPVALALKGSGPVVASVRTIAGKDETYAAAAAPLDGSSVFAVPAADTAHLVVTALEHDARLTVVPHAADGRKLQPSRVTVEARTTRQVALPRAARYVELVTSGGHGVAGLLVTRGAATGSIAVPPAVQALTLPSVRRGW